MRFITCKTVTETFLARVAATPNAVGFVFKDRPDSEWKTLTFRQFHEDCRSIALGLLGLGVAPGDRVALLSGTRVEWTLCDMAILGAQAVTVPIFPSSPPTDAIYILNHSEAKFLILETGKQLEQIFEARAKDPKILPHLKKIIVLESGAMMIARDHAFGAHDVLTLQALKELGRREEAHLPKRFEQNLASAQPEDLIAIFYTSGTTGIPKGVMLSHDNVMSVLEDCVALLAPHIGDKSLTSLSFLPFSHILGKVESLATFTFGWKNAFAQSSESLLEDLAAIKPDVLFSVPRVFEKAFAHIGQTLGNAGRSKRKIFAWAVHAGDRYYHSIREGKRPGLVDAAEYAVARKLVFNQLVAQFGGKLRFVVCGGAALSKPVAEFFQMARFEILEGYGLTETSGPVTVNTPGGVRVGSVGRPLPEVSLKLAPDGEILIKSRKVFQGYYKQPNETAAVLQEGWFQTGDIGRMDHDGFLRITDRKKDLIITSGGKNIAPQKIEGLAKAHKLITQFVVTGEGRNFLSALVTLDHEQVIRYANEHRILFSQYSELIKNPKILTLAQNLINSVNEELAPFERIRKFIILPNEFTIESGELTPSLKIKRMHISRQYKSALDTLYVTAPQAP